MRNPFSLRLRSLPVPARLGLPLALGGLAVLALIGLASAGSPMAAQADVPAPGDLDADFGIGGIVTTPIGTGGGWAYGVAVQEDGKIVVVGYQEVGSFSNFALARYTSSGELDGSFGVGGIVTTPIGTGGDCANDVALQGDGKIVAAGYASVLGYTHFAVARYTVSGTLDADFGAGGVITTSVGSGDAIAEGVAIQPDGKIVAVGRYVNGDAEIALVRYTISGTLDAGFGVGGIVTTSISSDRDGAYDVAIQKDRRIVVVGGTGSKDYDTAVLRYTTAGALDHTFGSGGVVTTPVGGLTASSVAIQGDGKIVVAGDDLLRYTTSGTLDTAFGVGGVVTPPLRAEDVAIQRDGRIVVAGVRGFAVARYTAAGAPDITFGVGGIVTTSVSPAGESAYAVALQQDGKIVVAGYARNGTDDDFAVVRYHGSYSVYLPLVLRDG